MENEIKLINDIIAMAIIHGGDLGGPYEVNTEGLVSSVKKWLCEKNLQEKYHVVFKRYWYALPVPFEGENPIEGNWPVFQIAPINEEGEDYSGFYRGNIEDIK